LNYSLEKRGRAVRGGQYNSHYTWPSDVPIIGKNNTCGYSSVYIASRAEDEALKIGFTTNDIEYRVNTLRRESMDKTIKVVKHYKGTYYDEQFLHYELEDFRLKNEWFILDDLQVKYIDSYFAFKEKKDKRYTTNKLTYSDFMIKNKYCRVQDWVPHEKVAEFRGFAKRLRGE
jgi:hypothetical protein